MDICRHCGSEDYYQHDCRRQQIGNLLQDGWSRCWTEVALGVALQALKALRDYTTEGTWAGPFSPPHHADRILDAATPEVPHAE